MLMRKGGVAGGVKNAEFSGNTRFKVVKPGQFRAHFGQNRASLGAFEFILIESVLESGPKRPHRFGKRSRGTSTIPAIFSGTRPGSRVCGPPFGKVIVSPWSSVHGGMRTSLGYLLAMGVAGVLSGSVLSQLPSNPALATRTLPPGYSALPTAGTPQHFASLPPVNVEIKTAIPANHEWLLKPQHGSYFISAKSFARPPRPTPEDQGPSALAMAEALAGRFAICIAFRRFSTRPLP